MADPGSEDPVARESTRLACAAVNQAMTSVDPRFMRVLMPGSAVPARFLKQFYGREEADLDRLPPETCRLMDELSPINHVRLGIPPTLLRYDDPLDAPYGIHHPSRRGPVRPGGTSKAGGGQPGEVDPGFPPGRTEGFRLRLSAAATDACPGKRQAGSGPGDSRCKCAQPAGQPSAGHGPRRRSMLPPRIAAISASPRKGQYRLT